MPDAPLMAIYDASTPDPAAAGPAPRFVAGLDLGKLSDYSALALLEWQDPPVDPGRRAPPQTRHYSCTTLKRWPLGTPYLEILAGVVKLFQAEPLAGAWPLLVVDSTGVGEAITEMCYEAFGKARARGHMAGVTITGGSAVTAKGNGRWNVAKKQLVSVLQVLMGQRRLHVAPALPEARTLLRELETFSVKITEAGNESFESWRERDHDDLVLAVALACWAAEKVEGHGPPAPRRREYLRG